MDSNDSEGGKRPGELESPQFELNASHRLLDEAGVMLTGLSSHAFVNVKLIRKLETRREGDVYESVTCMGQVGLHWSHARLPYAQFWRALHADQMISGGFRTLDDKPLAETEEGMILREFSSGPVPRVTCTASGTFVVQTFEFPHGAPESVNLFCAIKHTELHHPERDRLGNTFAMVPRIPTRVFIQDVWMHDSVPNKNPPVAGVYLPGSRLLDGPIQTRNFDRVAVLDAPALLGKGLALASLKDHSRHTELTRSLFAAMGWHSDEFTGYRTRAENPLWSMEYVTHFPARERTGCGRCASGCGAEPVTPRAV